MTEAVARFIAPRATTHSASFDPGERVAPEFSIEIKTADHTRLNNRDKPDQHPIKAITGLEEALENAGTHVIWRSYR